MPLLKPCLLVPKILELSPDFFREKGIRLVILDVDNTLTTHNNPVPAPGVTDWLRGIREAGIEAVILSNNTKERVRPFADLLGLPFSARACKPLTIGVNRVLREYGVLPEEAALIGDQIYTDIMGGNLAKVYTILTLPWEPETGWFFRLKRQLERPVLRRCRKGEKV